MKKNRIITVLVLCLLVSFKTHAATVSFSDSSSNVDLGASFSLIIQGTDFPTIVSGGLNLAFDPSILHVDSVTINQSVFEFYLGNGVEEGTINNDTGLLSDTSFNTFIGASGNFDIMTIGFTAVGAGSSLLTLSESAIWVFADFFGNYVGDQVVFNTANVTVTAVPIPAAAWLFAAGLSLLGVVGRKTRS